MKQKFFYQVFLGIVLMMKLSAEFLDATFDLEENRRLKTFQEYRENKKILIETGSARGTGIAKGLIAGFLEIYSVELDHDNYTLLKAMIRRERKELQPYQIHLYEGDSGHVFQQILPLIHEPVLFWLDAHECVDFMTHKNCPVLRELEEIRKHSIKTHTILIDDVRCFGGPVEGAITVEDLKNALYRINPNYEIKLEDGYVEKDVLTARIRKE